MTGDDGVVGGGGLPTDHGLHDEGATPEDSDLLEAGVPVLLDVV